MGLLTTFEIYLDISGANVGNLSCNEETALVTNKFGPQTVLRKNCKEEDSTKEL